MDSTTLQTLDILMPPEWTSRRNLGDWRTFWIMFFCHVHCTLQSIMIPAALMWLDHLHGSHCWHCWTTSHQSQHPSITNWRPLSLAEHTLHQHACDCNFSVRAANITTCIPYIHTCRIYTIPYMHRNAVCGLFWGILLITLLHMCSWLCQWKYFEHQRVFDEFMVAVLKPPSMYTLQYIY